VFQGVGVVNLPPFLKSRNMKNQEKEIIKCYEDEIKTSDKLIQAQRERITQLEDEVKFQKETVEKLFKMLDETIELAKKKTTFLPTPTLN
jgi:predicted RNase H-like nuclease (RuvC/YqgF family)